MKKTLITMALMIAIINIQSMEPERSLAMPSEVLCKITFYLTNSQQYDSIPLPMKYVFRSLGCANKTCYYVLKNLCAKRKIDGATQLTPLCWAIANSRKDWTDQLLAYGANPNLPPYMQRYPRNIGNIHGYPPLHYAVSLDQIEHVALLIKHNVDVNKRVGRVSPLHIAAAHNNVAIVQLLLENGATIQPLFEDNKELIDRVMIMHNNYEEVVRLLVENILN